MLGFYDYDWAQIWCDAIQEAVWSTQATPAIDALPDYAVANRVHGVTNFTLLASKSTYPLIGWRFLRAGTTTPRGIQRWLTPVTGEIKIARYGFADPAGAEKPTQWVIAKELRWAQEAIYRQPSLSGLTYGPFAVQNKAVVTGQGTGTVMGTLYPTFEVEDPMQNTTPGHPDNLGAMVWTGRMTATIPFIHR